MICTKNPRLDYLEATLQSLREQTLPLADWELIVVDNGSTPPLELDLAWHPQARILVEPVAGVVFARLRALQEAKGELWVFFDDDNVACPTYLADAWEIGRTHHWLGAWGAAEIVGKFESPVEPWAKPFLHMLALRSEKGNAWSNVESWKSVPYGAGMVLRPEVGAEFIQWFEENRESQRLGRKGEVLLSHEDIAIARMAFRLKLGTGIFECLRITHLIPSRRLEAAYLSRLSEGFGYSGVLDKWLKGEHYRPAKPGKLYLLGEYLRVLRMTPQARKCWRATRRGRTNALRYIEQQRA